MKSLIAVTILLALTFLGLTGVPACAGRMEGGKDMMMEKGDAMSKDGSMSGPEKPMMKESSGAMMEKGNPAKMRMASLAGSDGHHAAGTVVITTDQNGVAILRLKDIAVDRVPDGRVYLARNGDYRNGVELGRLTRFSGNVDFPIPARVHAGDYDSVVIWCVKFNVEIGHASLGESMSKDDSAMMGGEKTMIK